MAEVGPRRGVHRLCKLALALSTLCFVGSVQAQSDAGARSSADSSDSVAALNAAEDAFATGAAAFERGDTASALVHMRRAFELEPTYRNAAGLGQVELELGRYRAAAEHLEFSLRHYPAAGDAEGRANVMSGFSQARTHVGTITLEGQIPGVTFSIDGKPWARLPVAHDLFVEPGVRDFSFAKQGFAPGSQRVTVQAGAMHSLRVVLGAPLGASGSQQGRRGASSTDARPGALPAGAGSTAGSSTRDPSTATPSTVPATGTGWILIGGAALAVSAAATGAVFTVSADNARQRASELAQSAGGCNASSPDARCENRQQELQRAEDRDALALASYVTAAGVSLVSVGLYFWLASLGPGEQEQTVSWPLPVQLNALLLPNWGHVTWEGRF